MQDYSESQLCFKKKDNFELKKKKSKRMNKWKSLPPCQRWGEKWNEKSSITGY